MREAEAKKSGKVNASSNSVLPVIKDLPLKGIKNERSKSETNWIRGKSTDQAVKTRDAKGKSLLNKSRKELWASLLHLRSRSGLSSLHWKTMQIREGGAVVLLAPRSHHPCAR